MFTPAEQKQIDKYNYIPTSSLTKIEWLKLRQKAIGGSDAGAIMKMPGSFQTPVDVFLSKTIPILEEPEENIYMKFGRLLEPLIAELWMKETGLKVRNDHKMRFHPEHRCIGVNLDRVIVASDERGTGVLEVKTANSYYRKTWEYDIPLTYYAQIQHELAVTGYNWAECALLVDGREFERIPINPNPEFIANMIQMELDFWNNHVMQWTAPPPVEEEDIYKIHKIIPEDLKLEADQDLSDKVVLLKHLQEQVKPLDKEIAELKKHLKLALGEKSFLMEGEEVLATFKQQADREYFDTKGFKDEHPDLYKQFLKTRRGNRPLRPK